jgi:hypothetical protein
VKPGAEKPICKKCNRAHWFFQGCEKGTNPPVKVGYDTIQSPSDYRPPAPGRETGYASMNQTTHYRTMKHERNIKRLHYKEEE